MTAIENEAWGSLQHKFYILQSLICAQINLKCKTGQPTWAELQNAVLNQCLLQIKFPLYTMITEEYQDLFQFPLQSTVIFLCSISENHETNIKQVSQKNLRNFLNFQKPDHKNQEEKEFYQFYNESSNKSNHASSRVPYFCSPGEPKEGGHKFWLYFWHHHL